jgi:hypothetical protein
MIRRTRRTDFAVFLKHGAQPALALQTMASSKHWYGNPVWYRYDGK